MFKFEFKGGVQKTDGSTEKFLAFLIVNGKEHPLYEMLKAALVLPDKERLVGKGTADAWTRAARADHRFVSRHPYLKLMIQSVDIGVGGGKRQVFLYLRLRNDDYGSKIEISPWRPGTGFFFRAPAADILSVKQAKKLLQPGTLPYRMIEREQRNPQSKAFRSLITQETNMPGKGKVRKIS